MVTTACPETRNTLIWSLPQIQDPFSLPIRFFLDFYRLVKIASTDRWIKGLRCDAAFNFFPPSLPPPVNI